MFVKQCSICGIKATKVDLNGVNYCSYHINISNKNEKKTKRIYINDSDYWAAVAEAAKKGMDLRSHLSDLISRDSLISRRA